MDSELWMGETKGVRSSAGSEGTPGLMHERHLLSAKGNDGQGGGRYPGLDGRTVERSHGRELVLTVAGQRRTSAAGGHRLPRGRPLHPGMRAPTPSPRLSAGI